MATIVFNTYILLVTITPTAGSTTMVSVLYL